MAEECDQKHRAGQAGERSHRDNKRVVGREGVQYLDRENQVQDSVGLGRTATIWWTQNGKLNAVQDVHRLNVESQHALEALDVGVDSYKDVRYAFARDCPDLVCYQIVLRTELNMQIVMPSVIRHSAQQPYKAMARFETGTLVATCMLMAFHMGAMCRGCLGVSRHILWIKVTNRPMWVQRMRTSVILMRRLGAVEMRDALIQLSRVSV